MAILILSNNARYLRKILRKIYNEKEEDEEQMAKLLTEVIKAQILRWFIMYTGCFKKQVPV